MPTPSNGSSGSPSGTLLPPDVVPGDSGLAADAQKEGRARLQAYHKTMHDLDSNQSSVSDMHAYERVTQKEIDDLWQQVHNETRYLSLNPGMSASAVSTVQSQIQGHLTQIRHIMQQREALSNAQARKAWQWGQQYAGVASPTPSPQPGASPTPSPQPGASPTPSPQPGASPTPPAPSGLASGEAAFIRYAKIALKKLGIPPQYWQTWINGLVTAARRESDFNPYAINLSDSNAAAGDPSRGLMQVIETTFKEYRAPNTQDNIYNPVANIAAAINYVTSPTGPYGVNRNASNLAQLVPQFNPNDAPQGY